ncbi:class I glutamine amidotransferase-like protein [Aspergillus unguis]
MSSPLRIGVLLFPGFQALDTFGPLDCLNVLSQTQSLTLSLLTPGHDLSPVSTKPHSYPNSISQSIVPTHTLSNAPDIDVLLVPGGDGTKWDDTDEIKAVVGFIKNVYPKLQYLITVCTGAKLAARAGVLDGKRATTNKSSFHQTQAQESRWSSGVEGGRIEWVAKARWVVDGNVWTSSGVSAGIDLVLAWIGEVYGEGVAQGVANVIEYKRVKDSEEDGFAEVYGLA